MTLILISVMIFAQQNSPFMNSGYSGKPNAHPPSSVPHHTQNITSTIRLLDFEGVPDNTPVGNFYNGGAGPDYGVSFINGSVLIEGLSGLFMNEPSPPTIMINYGGNVTMNVTGGFLTNLSFYYADFFAPFSVSIYDGLNGTGNLLATQSFPINLPVYTCDAQNGACVFDPETIPFAGTAMSAVFSGDNGSLGLDNISFEIPGSTATIPTLGGWGLIFLAFALLTIGIVYMIRRRGLVIK